MRPTKVGLASLSRQSCILLPQTMRTLRDHRNGDLFDPWEYLGPQRRRLLEQSWAGVFREYLLEHLPVKEFSAAFRSDFGRPSKDLHVALGA